MDKIICPNVSVIPLYTQTQGRMKSKKAASLFASLSTPHKFTGPLSESKRIISVAELREGSNIGAVFVGGVSAIIPTTSRVP